MEVKISFSSYVSNFLDIDFDSDNIKLNIENEINKYLNKYKIIKLDDWKVEFRIIFTNTKYIFAYTRNKSDVVSKTKDLVIHLPIPTKEIILWGVDLSQHTYKNNNHLMDKINNFETFEPLLDGIENRTEYITTNISKTIKLIFEKGFTINKQKLSISFGLNNTN